FGARAPRSCAHCHRPRLPESAPSSLSILLLPCVHAVASLDKTQSDPLDTLRWGGELGIDAQKVTGQDIGRRRVHTPFVDDPAVPIDETDEHARYERYAIRYVGNLSGDKDHTISIARGSQSLNVDKLKTNDICSK